MVVCLGLGGVYVVCVCDLWIVCFVVLGDVCGGCVCVGVDDGCYFDFGVFDFVVV